MSKYLPSNRGDGYGTSTTVLRSVCIHSCFERIEDGLSNWLRGRWVLTCDQVARNDDFRLDRNELEDTRISGKRKKAYRPRVAPRVQSSQFYQPTFQKEGDGLHKVV